MPLCRATLQKGFIAILVAALAACDNSNSGGGSSSGGSSSSSSGSGSSSSSSSSGGSSSSSSGAGLVPTADAFTITNLVADVAGLQADSAAAASRVDAKLVNPWGIVFGAAGPVWIADNGSQSSTLYDGEGAAPRGPVAIPAAAGGDFNPSGVVKNPGSTDFVVSKGGASAAATFIFDGEGGSLAGWAPAVDANNAVIAFSAADGAVYKGLAVAQNAGANFLYATDFHNAKVDVFDKSFAKVSVAGAFAFKDPQLPAGYAPFGIAALSSGGVTHLYVAFAHQQAGSGDEAHGAGLGLVDEFNTDGSFVKNVVAAGGVLDAPWGLALAPADFGSAGGDLLVGNFGDGHVHVFNPASGAYVATLADASHAPIAIGGLWGIAFGNDASGLAQPHNTLFFTAGSNGEADGVYGRIDAGPAGPDFKPSVTVSAPSGTLKGTVTVSATASASVGIKQVQFFANGTSIGTAATAPFSVQWDTTKVADGSVTLTGTATDVDGNAGTSAPVTVTVSNAAAAHTTLTQLQTQIFTPICSGCHNGQGSFLPGSQNLSAGHTFSNVVNVASVEQPSKLRIKPSDPGSSYLVLKVEGDPSISNARMPDGCPATQPCLTQDQINMIIDWVNSGAPNN
jgi:uncharacterized protein (TIGR03118 family)